MDDLIGAMETALVEFSASRVAQPLRTVIEVGLQKAFFGVMPACIPEPASASVRQEHSRTSARPRQKPWRRRGPWREARHGLREQPGGRPADAPCDDRPARLDDGRAPRGDGRPLHHGGPHRGRVGGLGEAARARGRGRAGDDRLRRAGAQPPRRDRPRATPSRRARLEPERRTPRRLRAGDAAAHARAHHAVRRRPATPSTAPTSSCSPHRRASRSSAANGSATARTSAPSARAGPISARWTRRSCRAGGCSWIREAAR